jgi:hypothetical protein
LTLHYTFALLALLLFASCQSIEQKTLITERPLLIDSPDFKTIEQKFHYEKADTPSLFLGSLKPKLPLAEAYSFEFKEKCLWTSQGMLAVCYSLVAKQSDTLVLIDTEEKFRKTFAPIDNEQEAIGYVAYLTRTYPKYDISKKLRYRVYSSQFPSTYAKKVNGGFEVLLHDKKVFGCGPHPYFYKLFKVTDSGEITLLKTVKMFEDPEEDALCVD